MSKCAREFSEWHSAFFVNRAKYERSSKLLNELSELVEQEINRRAFIKRNGSRNSRVTGDDTEQTQEDPGYDNLKEKIFEPFFYLHSNPGALQSLLKHPHSEKLRLILTGDLQEGTSV